MQKNTLRSDYKSERNQKIYDEYTSSDVSFNTLAKKYKISPQRVKFIVDEVRTNALKKELSLTDTKSARENYKNLAVTVREQGNLALALDMFEKTLAWDGAHNNIVGEIDVLGHKKIALTLKADLETNRKKKSALLAQASETMQTALDLCKKSKVDSGKLAIQKVHFAGLLYKESELLTKQAARDKLTKALTLLNQAITDLPGTKAHKAWPLGIKARVQYALADTQGALESLYSAQKMLYEGYDAEVNKADQSTLKLRVWVSGTFMWFAHIFAAEKKLILAEIYASAVLVTPDPDGILKDRIREARELLKTLS